MVYYYQDAIDDDNDVDDDDDDYDDDGRDEVNVSNKTIYLKVKTLKNLNG